MQYQVPQFIEVEDKIFGPLTIRQFIYLAGGAGLCAILFVMVHPTFLAILLMVPVAGFALALAFYKVNNKPFIDILEAAMKYLVNPKLYIWRKEDKPVAGAEVKAADDVPTFVPKLSGSKLKDLTWSLGTKEALNPVTQKDDK